MIRAGGGLEQQIALPLISGGASWVDWAVPLGVAVLGVAGVIVAAWIGRRR